jgi:hypothetical protein
MADQPTVQTFSPHVGSIFRIEASDGFVELVLSEATAIEASEPLPPGGRAQFSLSFRGPPQPILPQRIYRLAHDALGVLEIFLVPIGADDEAVTYEAVFA